MMSIYDGLGVFMKEILLKGLKLFFTLILVNVMCFFLTMSFNVITMAVFTEEIGYKIYETDKETEKQTEAYTHFFKDGEDKNLKKYEDGEPIINKIPIRTEPKKSAKITMEIITEIFCLLILIFFIYNDLRKIGARDINSVKYESHKEDKLKGLKIGLVAIAPSIILLIIALATPKFSTVLFGLLNTYAYQLIFSFSKGITYLADMAVWKVCVIGLFLLIVPVVSAISYLFGYKSISIKEKLIYKKVEE